MRKFITATLVAAMLAVSVPHVASAQSAYDYEVLATFQFPTPEESCSRITTQQYITYGGILWLTSLAQPGSGSTIPAEDLAAAVLAAYAYMGALSFSYWWYECNTRIF